MEKGKQTLKEYLSKSIPGDYRDRPSEEELYAEFPAFAGVLDSFGALNTFLDDVLDQKSEVEEDFEVGGLNLSLTRREISGKIREFYEADGYKCEETDLGSFFERDGKERILVTLTHNQGLRHGFVTVTRTVFPRTGD